MRILLGIAIGMELVRPGDQIGEHLEGSSRASRDVFAVKTMKNLLSLGSRIEGIEYCAIDLLESETVKNVVDRIRGIFNLVYAHCMGITGGISVGNLVHKAFFTD
jgi:hypothetical protein